MRASSIVSSKGQVVIPAVLRKKYNLNEGVMVVFEEDESGNLTLKMNPYEALSALGGTLKGYPLEEALMEEREAERLREDRPR